MSLLRILSFLACATLLGPLMSLSRASSSSTDRSLPCHIYLIIVDPIAGVGDSLECTPFVNNTAKSLRQAFPNLAASGRYKSMLSETYRQASVDELQCCLAHGDVSCESLGTALSALNDFRMQSSTNDSLSTVVVQLQRGTHTVSERDADALKSLGASDPSLVLLGWNFGNETTQSSPPTANERPNRSEQNRRERGQGKNCRVPEMPGSYKDTPVVRCSGLASNGSQSVLFNVTKGGWLSVLGVDVEYCHFGYAMITVTHGKVLVENSIFR